MEELLNLLGSYLKSAAIGTFWHLLFLGAVLFVPALLLHGVSVANERLSSRIFGFKTYLWLFGWLGTAVHELAHALFALIFGHRLGKIQLFKPDYETGTMGYVEHFYNPRSWYQRSGNFFIGTAPLWVGCALLLLLFYILFKVNVFSFFDEAIFSEQLAFNFHAITLLSGHFLVGVKTLASEVISGNYFSWWRTALCFYALFSVGAAMGLSMADVKTALKGMLIWVLLLFMANLVLTIIGIPIPKIVGNAMLSITILMAITMLLNFLFTVFLLLLLPLVRAFVKTRK